MIKNENCWTQRSLLGKSLIFASIFIGLIILISAAGYIVSRLFGKCTTAGNFYDAGVLSMSSNELVSSRIQFKGTLNPENNSNKICFTKECIHTASNILESLDPSVEPCDDFYKFSCGSYLKNTDIPEDKVTVNTFSKIGDELQKQLKQLISEEPSKNLPKPFKLVNWLYKSCMNKTLIEKRGMEPLKNIVESLGGWPVIAGQSWVDKQFEWEKTIMQFRKLGYSVDYIIDFSVGIDLKNSTQRIIDLDQPSTGLSREYLIKGFNDYLVDAYYKYMVAVAVIFGANEEYAKKELRNSLEFEIALANV